MTICPSFRHKLVSYFSKAQNTVIPAWTAGIQIAGMPEYPSSMEISPQLGSAVM